MDFYCFHLMPWDGIDEPTLAEQKTAWTTVPNSHYEAERGHELYNRYLDELIYAEELGFDGVCLNEHHQSPTGTMPSPNLMGAILARQTRRVKIAILGNALPLHNPPTRVAEEFAMIDVISGGRLIAGMVIGGGPEYYNSGVNPTFARNMYDEALDLILRAWTEAGPFEHYGKHWKLKYVNPWPTPLQKPHPPIWVPGMGSTETIKMVAQRGFGYMGIPFFHADVLQKNLDQFRKACSKEGNEATPDRIGQLLPIYVAESDEAAWAEYESHLFYFAHQMLKGFTLLPPGYTSSRSTARINQALKQFLTEVKTRQEVEEGSYAIVGSPATVRDRLKDLGDRLGFGNLLGLFQLGTLPADLTRKNMQLFADEVMPQLRQDASQGGE